MNIAFFGRVRISTTEPAPLSHPEQLHANFHQLWERRFHQLDDLLKSSETNTTRSVTAGV